MTQTQTAHGPGAHDHGVHGHGLGGHSHAPSPNADRRLIWAALLLLSAFLVVEVVLAFVSGSLALLADAGHMLTDVAALVLALIAISLAARPARGRYTFGYRRAEILSAQANGLTLVLLGVWFFYEGVHRLIDPEEVEGGIVLAVALVGIVVNLICTWLLNRADRTRLNVEGAFQHILTDLYAFIGTGVSGVIVLATGWMRADSIAALVVAAIMLRSGSILVLRSGRILLEAAPSNIDPDALVESMESVPGVFDVHDLHVWEVTSGSLNLSAHVLVEDELDCHAVRFDVQRKLVDEFGIAHLTLQVDHAGEHYVPSVDDAGCCADDHAPVHR